MTQEQHDYPHYRDGTPYHILQAPISVYSPCFILLKIQGSITNSQDHITLQEPHPAHPSRYVHVQYAAGFSGGVPGGLRCTAESMATMRPACTPKSQKSTLWGLPRQPRASQGSRSALPSSISSRNSLRERASLHAVALLRSMPC